MDSNKIFLYLCMQILLNIKSEKMKTNEEKGKTVRELQALADSSKKPKLNFKNKDEEQSYFSKLAYKHRVTDLNQAF